MAMSGPQMCPRCQVKLPILSHIGLEILSPLECVRTLMPSGPGTQWAPCPPTISMAQPGIPLLWLFLSYGFSSQRMEGKVMKSCHQAPDWSGQKWENEV